ncbi:MAG: hypothetical protein AB7K08_11660 [Microbacteriaceae bacterium]
MFQTRTHASTYRGAAAQRHEREADQASTPLPPQTDAQAQAESVLVTQSLRTTRARLAGALDRECVEHSARRGVYCWQTDSGVRAICLARYVSGAGSPARLAPPGFDYIAEIAAAARNAQRDARLRLQVRHPNRHHISTPSAEVAR